MQLEKYLTTTRQYKQWSSFKDEVTQETHWRNLSTLEVSRRHPGFKVFEANKGTLKKKAEEELD